MQSASGNDRLGWEMGPSPGWGLDGREGEASSVWRPEGREAAGEQGALQGAKGEAAERRRAVCGGAGWGGGQL